MRRGSAAAARVARPVGVAVRPGEPSARLAMGVAVPHPRCASHGRAHLHRHDDADEKGGEQAARHV